MIPPRKEFYSKLNMKGITQKKINWHAQKVWDTFKINNLGEYHDLYVQTDTLLLADVFENFRKTCLDIYQLDPVHFVSFLNLAWQACLKINKVKLELLTDYDMLLMVEQEIGRGICQAIYRYATADNKYVLNRNKNIPSTYLEYLDANNLYGWVMCKKSTVSDFNWSKPKYRTEERIQNYDENSDYGVILEADVEYPYMTRVKHKNLAFLPEKRKINKIEKLVTILLDKKTYVIHISALKQALNHGLKLKKVHRAIMFRQEAWMKKYIDKNTDLRKDAKSEFENDFFKLMNNSVFGKTRENVRNHRDIKLV